MLSSTLRESKPAEIAIAFPDNAAASVVFGHYDQNIARIERSLGVSAYANGNQVVIKGPKEASEQARRVFEMLYERVKMGQAGSEGDVEGAIAESAYQGLLFPGEEGTKDAFGVIRTRKRGMVRARSAAQDHYLARHAQVRTRLRRRSGRHRQDVAGCRPRRVAARTGAGRAAGAVASGGRGGRATRLPARRHARQGRSLSAPDLRRALRLHGRRGWSSAASRPA